MDEAKPFKIPKREVWEAFKRVKANQGAAGVDGQSIADFEAHLTGNLYKLWNRLSSGRSCASMWYRSAAPISCPGVDRQQILGAMTKDKKVREGRVRFVLPIRPGQIEVGVEAPEARVGQIIDELRGGI